jgi:molybdate transport system ATP-binding protein
VIECRGICARVGNFEIRDAAFVVPAGEHAVLTGPTASGKTTLLEIIAGAVNPAAGLVRIGDADVTDDAPELRGVGIVPQHGYLFPHLSTRGNVAYGARDGDTASRLARRFGIEHLMDRTVSALSGGERQIVALCRALAPRPSALLMDEPFSALDESRRRATLREFHELQAEWHLTVLHVTHDATDAAFATLQFAMADGVVSVAERAPR